MKLKLYLGGHQRSGLWKVVNIQIVEIMINIPLFLVFAGKLGLSLETNSILNIRIEFLFFHEVLFYSGNFM
jgi:hypothetical protein